MGNEVNSYPSTLPPSEAPPPYVEGGSRPPGFVMPSIDWQMLALLLIRIGLQMPVLGPTLAGKHFHKMPHMGTLHNNIQVLMRKLEFDVLSKLFASTSLKGNFIPKEGSSTSSNSGLLQNVKNVYQGLVVFKFLLDKAKTGTAENPQSASLKEGEKPVPAAIEQAGTLPSKVAKQEGGAPLDKQALGKPERQFQGSFEKNPLSSTGKEPAKSVQDLLQMTRLTVDLQKGKVSPEQTGEKIIKDLNVLRETLQRFISATEKKFAGVEEFKPFIAELKDIAQKLQENTTAVREFLQDKSTQLPHSSFSQSFKQVQGDLETTLQTLLKEFTAPVQAQRQIPQRFQVMDTAQRDGRPMPQTNPDVQRNVDPLQFNRPVFAEMAEKNGTLGSNAEKNALAAHILRGLISESGNPAAAQPLVQHDAAAPPLSFVVPYFSHTKDDNVKSFKSKGRDKKEDEQEYQEGNKDEEQDLSYL